jgi:site-specific DNA recombinase
MSKPRAVLYLRQSTEKEESISMELQESSCREHCKKKGYDVVAVYSDPGISGRTFKRPGVAKAMDMIERKDADVIVLWRWNRLSRNTSHWFLAAEKVESVGGRIESAEEDIDTSTSVGQLSRGMFVQFAAFESARIGDVWKETHARRIRMGLPANGKPRFGYTYSRENGFRPDPVTGELLRKLYLDYIAGTGFWKLAQFTRAHGGPSQATGAKDMMDTGFGAGYITHRGELIQGAHQAVISEDEWRAYKVARRERSGRPRAESAGHLYSGLVRCECGASMSGNHFNDRRTGERKSKYNCAALRAGGDHTNTVITPTIDTAVLDFLRGVAEPLDARAAGVRANSKPVGRIDARPKILADLSKVAVKIDSATEKYIAGDIQKDTYDRTIAKFREQQQELEDRLESLEVKLQAPPPVEAAANLVAHWDLMPLEVKRSILKSLGISIVVGRAGGGRWNPKEVRVSADWEA